MTYWPISSPSVFAATKNTNLERTPISHDGTDRATQSGRHGASETGSADNTDDDDTSIEDGEGAEAEKSGQTESQAQTPGQFAEDDVHGEIVAIRVTRSGQLFATLTRTTLTIWQTKVCSLLSRHRASLICSLAHRNPSFSSTLAAIPENIRSKHRHPTSP